MFAVSGQPTGAKVEVGAFIHICTHALLVFYSNV